MTVQTMTPRRLAALLAGLILAAGACSSPAGDETSTATDPPATDAASDGTDTDETVTGATVTGSTIPTGPKEPVVVAVLYPDLSLAADFGFAEEVSDFAPVFEAFMDDANERGGIAGHPIELEMVQFDLAIAGDSSRACLTATQDLDAFLVLGTGGVFGDPVVCVTEQNETLMIQDDGSPGEFYERAEGRLFTIVPSKDDTQRAIVEAFADELGAAPFAVFSALDTGGDHETMERTLLPALADAGLDPAVTVVLDSDAEIAASQIPIEVGEIQAAGVETIISTAGFVPTAPFTSALEAAGVDVLWVGSDAAGFASALYASQLDPAQVDGARAITVRTAGWENAGLEEPAAQAACRARAGELLGTEVGIDSIDLAGANYACNFADLIVAAGEAVEGDLTTESMAAALRALTEIDLASYGPAGFDGGSSATRQGRLIEWTADCACWSPIGEYQPLTVG